MPRLHAHYYPRACYWYALRIGGMVLWRPMKDEQVIRRPYGACVSLRIGWRLWTLSVTVPA